MTIATTAPSSPRADLLKQKQPVRWGIDGKILKSSDEGFAKAAFELHEPRVGSINRIREHGRGLDGMDPRRVQDPAYRSAE